MRPVPHARPPTGLPAGQEQINAQNSLLLAAWSECDLGLAATPRRRRSSASSPSISASTTVAFIGANFLVSTVFAVLQIAIVYTLVPVLADGIPGDRIEITYLVTILLIAAQTR